VVGAVGACARDLLALETLKLLKLPWASSRLKQIRVVSPHNGSVVDFTFMIIRVSLPPACNAALRQTPADQFQAFQSTFSSNSELASRVD